MTRQILSNRLRRREFLKAGSATVAGPALAALSGEHMAGASAEPGIWKANSTLEANHDFGGLVSVGYYDGKPGSRFRDVRTLGASGDATAFESARVQVIDGDASGIAAPGPFRSLSLYFDELTPWGDPICVWYRQFEPIPQSGPSTSFSLPLNATNGLAGWLDFRLVGSQSTRLRAPVTLGSTSLSSASALRSGYYMIAVTPGSGIAWDGIDLRGSCDGNTLCLNQGGNSITDAIWVLLAVTLTTA